MTTQSPDVATHESFPAGVCPSCGYLLNGLPPVGVCPECGIFYSDTQLILYGWACGRHATTNNSRGLRFILGLIPFFLAWQLLLPTSKTLRLVVAGSCILSIVLSLIRRKRTDLPGRIQIRLNRDGMVQIDDLATLRGRNPDTVPTHWDRLKIDMLKQRSNGRIRIRMKYVGLPWYVMLRDAYPVDAEIQSDRMSLETLNDTIARLSRK
jgi:hypothetical protein